MHVNVEMCSCEKCSASLLLERDKKIICTYVSFYSAPSLYLRRVPSVAQDPTARNGADTYGRYARYVASAVFSRLRKALCDVFL